MQEVITNRLWLGDYLDAKQHGDKMDLIIHLCDEFPAIHSHTTVIPVEDRVFIDPKKIKKVVEQIELAMEAGKKTLVHCAAGISRSPAMVAAYLVVSGKFQSLDKATNYLAKLRPKVNPHTKTFASVRDWLKSK
jgi:predicted protein tyrosine phosphatase